MKKKRGCFFLCLLSLSCKVPDDKFIVLSGTVEIVEVNIASEVPGRIEKIAVDEGDRVRSGDLLVKIENEKYRLQCEQAEAQLKALKKNLEAMQLNYENVKKNFERVRNLKEESAIDEAQYEMLKTQKEILSKQIEMTRAQIEGTEVSVLLAKTQLNNTEIRSPIDGLILHKLVEKGEVVGAGMPLLTVGDIDHPWVRTYIPQKYLGRIKYGDKVSIYTDSFPGKEFTGKVVYISSKEEFTPKNLVTEEERTKMVYAIKIAIDNRQQEFKSGQYVDVKIKLNE